MIAPPTFLAAGRLGLPVGHMSLGPHEMHTENRSDFPALSNLPIRPRENSRSDARNKIEVVAHSVRPKTAPRWKVASDFVWILQPVAWQTDSCRRDARVPQGASVEPPAPTALPRVWHALAQ